jgi:hypothetical protein
LVDANRPTFDTMTFDGFILTDPKRLAARIKARGPVTDVRCTEDRRARPRTSSRAISDGPVTAGELVITVRFPEPVRVGMPQSGVVASPAGPTTGAMMAALLVGDAARMGAMPRRRRGREVLMGSLGRSACDPSGLVGAKRR